MHRLSPTALVQAVLYVTGGTDLSAAQGTAQAAVDAYARTLDIGATVYRAAIIEALMGTTGAYNVDLLAPAVDTALADNEVFVPTYLLTTQH